MPLFKAFKKQKHNEIYNLSALQIAIKIEFPGLIVHWVKQVESLKLGGTFLVKDNIKIQSINLIAENLNEAILLIRSEKNLAYLRNLLSAKHIASLTELNKKLNTMLDEMLVLLASPQVYKSVPRIKKIAPSDMPLTELRNGTNVILNPLGVAVQKLRNEISRAKNMNDALEIAILDLKKDLTHVEDEEIHPRSSRISSTATFRST